MRLYFYFFKFDYIPGHNSSHLQQIFSHIGEISLLSPNRSLLLLMGCAFDYQILSSQMKMPAAKKKKEKEDQDLVDLLSRAMWLQQGLSQVEACTITYDNTV